MIPHFHSDAFICDAIVLVFCFSSTESVFRKSKLICLDFHNIMPNTQNYMSWSIYSEFSLNESMVFPLFTYLFISK